MQPEDFYRLDAAQGRVSSARLEYMLTKKLLEDSIAAAELKRNAVLEELAAKYGFDPNGSYVPDEATMTLVVRRRT